MRFADREGAVSWIMDKKWERSRPGLSRMQQLLRLLDHPEKSLPVIHVAGTNGKGSVCRMLQSILKAAGYTVGLFQSPAEPFEARILIGDVPIDEKSLTALTKSVYMAAKVMTDHPSQFELTQALAFLYYKKMVCDIVILETGMGGRLDATNVITHPALTVITAIGLDHTAYLGNTLKEIAKEKAGILKKGTPAIFLYQDPSVNAVLEQTAKALEVPYHFAFANDAKILPNVDRYMHIAYKNYADLPLSLHGSYQKTNAAIVLESVDLLRIQGYAISEDALRFGLSHTVHPGRFQIIENIVVDGAHNPHGMAAFTKSFQEIYPGEKAVVLFGCFSDKDYITMLKELKGITERFILTRAPSPRGLDPKEMLPYIGDLSCTIEQSPKEAIQKLVECDANRKICCGSLSLTDLFLQSPLLPQGDRSFRR